jgi:hypothetical protein
MALFNLTDITFNGGKGATGPLSALATTKFGINTYKYPTDLGSIDKAHYIVININEQARTQFPGTRDNSAKPTIVSNFQKTGVSAQGVGLVSTEFGRQVGQVGSELLGKAAGFLNSVGTGPNATFGGNGALDQTVQVLSSGAAGGLQFAQQSVSNLFNNPQFTRTVRRITDTVCLYMPDTLGFSYNQSYDTPTIGGTPVAALMAGGASTVDAFNANKNNPRGLANALGKNLSPFIASMLMNTTGTGRTIFAASTGVVQNPMLEILYSSPAFRTFRFDFMMYPRSEKEALEVQNIIDRLRFHQAPEVLKQGNGFFLVPPSEFDITFMYNGKENPNIPKISTCVLESIDTDYSPGGPFAAYEVPGQTSPTKGGTGMPVGIRLSLQFKETEIITKSSPLLNSQRGNAGDVQRLGGGDINDPNSDYNTGANGWGNYGE